MNDPNLSPKKKKGNKLLRFSGMAFQMGFTITAGALGGQELDARQQNEKPLWTIFFSLLAIIASLYLVIRQAKKLSDD